MSAHKILITGGHGMLARALTDVFAARGQSLLAPARDELDVTDATAIRRMLQDERPDIVIQCAAFTRVDDAESHEVQAFEINAIGAANVALACRDVGARFVFPSTDYVFDGAARTPYPTDAPPNPINIYGRTKLAGESAAHSAGDYLIVRTCWLYGAGGRNFVRTVVDRLAAGQPLRVVNDQRGAPTWTVDLAHTIAGLLDAHAPAGVYHATNAGSATWHELATEIARLRGHDEPIEGCTTAEYPTPARRPAYSVLDCTATERITGPARPWQTALAEALEAGAY